jgi:hypothetical protein
MPSKKILEMIVSDKNSTNQEVKEAEAQLAVLDTTDILTGFLRFAGVSDIQAVYDFEKTSYEYAVERKIPVELEMKLWIAHGTEPGHAKTLCSFNHVIMKEIERQKKERA